MKLGVVGGAGLLGSTSAYLAGLKGYLDEIKIVDVKENLAKNHAMDMDQAVYSFGKTKVTYANYEDLKDCGVILFTASMPERQVADRMEYLRDNMNIVLPICKKLKEVCNEAVIINATNPVDIFNYLMWETLGWDRKKILGFNGNDTYRLKWAVSKITGIPFDEIDGLCIGEHGLGHINLYDKMTASGNPMNLTDAQIDEAETITKNYFAEFQALNSGRTSGWTSAINIEELIEAVATNSGKVLECSSVLQGELGLNDVSIGFPVSVGAEGIISYEMPPLTSEQNSKLIEVCDRLKDTISQLNY